MIGAILTSLIWGFVAALALRPPRPRHSTRFNLQFALTWWINEIPIIGLWVVLSGTAGTLVNPVATLGWWATLMTTIGVTLLLARLLLRGFAARPILAQALEEAYGAAAAPKFTRPPWWRILVLPVFSWRPGIRRIRNVAYGAGERRNRLDVYVSSRVPPRNAPVLVYLHPGGFIMGSKLLGSRPLFYRLSALGWVCISANYRLGAARYSDQLADTRGVVAWVNAHIRSFGGNPNNLFLAGGSAGAHLVTMAALTGENARGVIGMYGYYGGVGGEGAHSPMECVQPQAPPFFIIHGELDPLVLHEDAQAFAQHLSKTSDESVVYAKLPGGNHNFDFFPSVRFHAVIDAILCFADQHQE